MPGIGSLLYRLNVNSFVVGKMVAGHVYSDSNWLSGERLIQKRQVMAAPGARFASAAFVTGALDRVSSRADFLALAVRAAVPIFLRTRQLLVRQRTMLSNAIRGREL